MELGDKWSENYTVRSYQSDKFTSLHLHSLAHFLQESAWRHAEASRVGYHDLIMINRLWILSGLKIRIYEYPKWSDEIRVDTWSRGIEELFAYRDYEIFNNRNRMIAAASSSWLIIDVKSHRPCRMTKELMGIPSGKSHSAMGIPSRLPPLRSGIQAGSLSVQYSDLDIYQHVNNTRYIEWCINCLPVNTWENDQIEEIQINFLSECLIGQELRFFMENDKDRHFRLSAQNQNSGKEVFRAEILLTKKVLTEETMDPEMH